MGKITEETRRQLEINDDYNKANIPGIINEGVISEEFARTLNALFEKSNMSTQQIVNLTGISKSYINKLRDCTQTVKPSRYKIINIGLALNASESEINTLLKTTQLQELYSRYEP